MTLNIITVTLNLGIYLFIYISINFSFLIFIKLFIHIDAVNFLGISIVGQSDKAGASDGGIYVGSIMKGYRKSIKMIRYNCLVFFCCVEEQ